jgi:hypothetical protein
MFRKHVAALVFSLLITPKSGVAQASPASNTNASTGVVSVYPICEAPTGDGFGGGCSDFPPQSCQQDLDSYTDMLKQPLSDYPGSYPSDVRDAIRKELNSEVTCEKKNAAIQEILNAYWSSDPWCIADKKVLIKWMMGDEFKKVPDYAQRTITDTLDDTIACRDGTTAVSLLLPRYGVTSPLAGPSIASNSGANQFKGQNRDVALMAKKLQKAERKAQRAIKKCSGKRKG